MIIRCGWLCLVLILFPIIVGCGEKLPIIYSPLKNNYQSSSNNEWMDEYIKEKEKLYGKLTKQTIAIGNTEDEDEGYAKNNEEDKLDPAHHQTIENHNDLEWFERGCQSVISGKWGEALIAFNNVIKLDPQNTEAYFYRGNMYDELGDYEKAIADYNKTIKLNPVHIDAYLRRGFAYNNLGKSNKAIDNIKIAAKLGDNIAQRFLKERGIAW